MIMNNILTGGKAPYSTCTCIVYKKAANDPPKTAGRVFIVFTYEAVAASLASYSYAESLFQIIYYFMYIVVACIY